MIASILVAATNKKARFLYYFPILLSLYFTYILSLIVGVFLGILVGTLQGFLDFNEVKMKDGNHTGEKKITVDIPIFFVIIVFLDIILSILFIILSFINPYPLIGLIKIEPQYLVAFIPSVFLSVFCEVFVLSYLLRKKISIHLKE